MFVQQSQRRLKATKEEEKEKNLILYHSDKEEHDRGPKEHDYNDKDSNWNGNKKNI